MDNKASLLEQIKAFFIKLFTVIVSFFHHLFHIDKKEEKTTKVTITTKEESTKKENIIINDNTTLPDEPSTLTNPHNDGDEETPNEVVLVLPKTKVEVIKTKAINSKRLIITKELIEELIETAIEEIEEYKKIDFKVKDADKETKEVIKEFKEKVIPKINYEIEHTKPKTDKELMDVVTEVVKEQNKLTPIIPKEEEKKETPKKDVIELDIDNDKKPDLTLKVDKKKKEPYFMASIAPETKLNLKDNTPVKKETKIAKTVPEVKEEIKDKADDVPIRMVKNTPDIVTPSVKEEVKNVALVAAVTIAKVADTILTSTPQENKEKIKEEVKEVKKEDPKPKEEIKELDIPELKQIDDKIKESEKPKELELVTQELKDIEKKIEEKQEEIEKVEEETPKEEIKEEPKKEKKEIFIDDTIIDNISEDISKVTVEANEEIKKEDIEDKNYEQVEKELDRILKDIDKTKYKYKDTMPEVQLRKLEAQEAKIEQTKYSIDAQKKIDLNNERKHLEEIIQDSEKENLKQEINRLHLEHQMEMNNELLKRTDKITNLSEKQIADIEKRIIKKRLRDAYRHATITSMIAFPFIRSKYFFYFTAGMMVKTFFLQIGHVLNRNKDDLTVPDMIALKNGENALDEAINITDDNINTLNYLTIDTINKYPELQYDDEYINYVNGLKQRLNQNYDKLTRKRHIIDRTIHRSKKDIKILKKIRKKEMDKAA